MAESALSLILDTARREAFLKVKAVHFAVGELSCVMPDALRFAFSAHAKGTCAEGAQIIIEQVGAVGECPACHHRAPVPSRYEACPCCETVPMRVIAGDELKMVSLDVE